MIKYLSWIILVCGIIMFGVIGYTFNIWGMLIVLPVGALVGEVCFRLDRFYN